MKTRTGVSATTRRSASGRRERHVRRMSLALVLLAAGAGFGGCDQRTVIALTLVAPPASDLTLPKELGHLDLRVLSGGVEIDCKTYALVRPGDGGTGGSFEVKADKTREARLLYYPTVDSGTLTLEVNVYADSQVVSAGGRGYTQVTLVPHQLNAARIDPLRLSPVAGLCLRPDLLMVNDLSVPPDLTRDQGLTTPTDMAIDQQEMSRPYDLVVPPLDAIPPPRDLTTTGADALQPPYDFAVTDGNPTQTDLSIADQGPFPYDLTVSDGPFPPIDGISVSDLNGVIDCNDNNPCTYDYSVLGTDGTYTCQYQPSPQGTVCRPPVGTCDLPEVCDGRATQCPPDTLRSVGALCRLPLSPCDAPETCTGNSPNCPAPDAPPLCNGNFDANTFGLPWLLTGVLNQLISNDAPCQPLSSPSYNLLRGDLTQLAQTSQTIFIPPGKGSLLTFSLQIAPDPNRVLGENDFFAEVLDGPSVVAQLGVASSKVTFQGYMRYALDLPPLQSPNPTLRFKALATNLAYAASFCLDDVSIVVP